MNGMENCPDSCKGEEQIIRVTYHCSPFPVSFFHHWLHAPEHIRLSCCDRSRQNKKTEMGETTPFPIFNQHLCFSLRIPLKYVQKDFGISPNQSYDLGMGLRP